MPSARHILIVNSRNVQQPVFVVGAPHSGTDLIGRALKAASFALWHKPLRLVCWQRYTRGAPTTKNYRLSLRRRI